jgi:peroxiredoxin
MRAALLAIVCASFAGAADPLTTGKSMESFQLRDTKGAAATFQLTKSRSTVLIFYSTQCPISNEYNERMNAIYKEYTAKDVQVIFANANQNESLNEMVEHAKSAEFVFPVFKDTGNVLADRLGATVTPQAYLFDSSGSLRYQGHIDDARNPARAQVHGLRNALEQLLNGQQVAKPESKAFGCTIKRVRKAS